MQIHTRTHERTYARIHRDSSQNRDILHERVRVYSKVYTLRRVYVLVLISPAAKSSLIPPHRASVVIPTSFTVLCTY